MRVITDKRKRFFIGGTFETRKYAISAAFSWTKKPPKKAVFYARVQ